MENGALETRPCHMQLYACNYIGKKYHSKHGGTVLRWFVKHHKDESKEWITRYALFKEDFSRSMSMPTLYRILEDLTKDNILEIRLSKKNAHCFSLNKDYLPVIEAIAHFLDKND